MIRAKAKERGPSQWVYNLGGWSPDQFTDDKRSFTRAELDPYSPDNPVFLQFSRAETFLNSKAIEAIGLEKMNQPSSSVRTTWGRSSPDGSPTSW